MRKIIGLLIVMFLIVFCGCFDYEEAIVLEKDNSGTIQMKFTVEKAYLNQMFAMMQEMAKAMPDMDLPKSPQEMMFNNDEIVQALDAEDAGLKLVSREISEDKENQIWDMKFSFTDINNVDLIYDALSPEEADYGVSEESQDTEHQPLLVKQADGTYLFYRPFANDMTENMTGGDDAYYDEEETYQDNYNEDDNEEDSEEATDDDSESYSKIGKQIEEGLGQISQEVEALGENLAKKKFRFSFTFPGKLVESNATSVKGNTLVWEYTMEELQATQPEQRAVIKF